MVAGMALSVNWSRLKYLNHYPMDCEIQCPQRMVPPEFLVISWFYVWHHQQVDIIGF